MPSLTYHSPPGQHAFHEYQSHHDISYSQSYTTHSAIPNQLYVDGQELNSPQFHADALEASADLPTDAMSTTSVQPNEPKPAFEPYPKNYPPSRVLVLAGKHISCQNVTTSTLTGRLKYLAWLRRLLRVFGHQFLTRSQRMENVGNDKVQASLMSEISSLRAEAATAASAQRSAVTALAQLEGQFNNIGFLRAWEFCDGQKFAVCKSLRSSSTDVVEALSSLDGLILRRF